jgi:hypothetical protein
MRTAFSVLVLTLTLAGLVPAPLGAQTPAGPPFSRPGLLTSVGQSSDVVVVKALLNTQLKMDFKVVPVAKVQDLDGMKSLVIVVGASTKGLGAAGLDMPKELARAGALIKAAQERKIPIVAMHTGGEARRGPTSNEAIELVVPAADHVIVVASGNKDKKFQALAAARKAPVVEVDRLAAAGQALKGLFGN